MNRSLFTYFIFVCLFLLVISVGIFVIGGVFYDNSTSVRRSRVAVDNSALGETSHMSHVVRSLNDRLRQGDLENGRKAFRQCAVCHSSERNEKNRVGPALWGVVNRPFADVEGFAYSRALRTNADQKWDFLALDRYLQSPRGMIPGTLMAFRGVKNDQERADLLLYLRSLSDHPAPLPPNDEGSESD